MANLRMGVMELLLVGFAVSSVTSSITDVPVLIWGGDSPTKSISKSFNLFEKTSQKQFKEIIAKKVGESQYPVIVFYKHSFCREDVTLHDRDQWKQLEKFGSLRYVPEVDGPLAVFETLPFYNQTLDEDLNSVSNGQLAINRANDLDYVVETFKMLKESSANLIGVLTGKTCSHSKSDRIKRAASPEPQAQNGSEPIFHQSERVLFYLENPPTLQMKGSNFVSVGQPSKAEDSGKGTADSPLVIKMDFDVVANDSTSYKASLAFEIVSKTSGYFTLHRVNVTRDSKEYTLATREDINWPQNFSYHCAQAVQFSMPKVNDTEEIKLNLQNLQVQVGPAKKFGDTYDCVGFTSISIWSGIFVTAILAFIMIWGLVMMMDIRTMDRFDDSKGKTITISAQE